MANEDHPCRNGLTGACFAAYPEWARNAFAYRLLYTLYPGAITKLLPRELFRLRIGPDAQIPPGWIPPDGMIIPPGFIVDPTDLGYLQLKTREGLSITDLFPPGWTTEDPLPDGVEIDSSGIFPPGWTPQDPAPEGVVISPDAQFPTDWTAQDPAPDGISISPDAQFPSGWTPPDPTPPGITIPTGTQFPSGWSPADPPPPDVTVSPGASFPQGWTPGDTLPAGVTIGPGASFPPGWQAGDPTPSGVTIAPGASFPQGWNPGDPLPAGVTRRTPSLPGVPELPKPLVPEVTPVPVRESFPPGWAVGDPIPPIVVVDMRAILAHGFDPAYTGPRFKYIFKDKTPKSPPGGPIAPSTLNPNGSGNVVIQPEQPEPSGYWFEDAFTTLDMDIWGTVNSGGGTATIVGEKLRLLRPIINSNAGIARVDARGGINPWRWSATINLMSQYLYLEMWWYSSTAHLTLTLFGGNEVYVDAVGDCAHVDLPAFWGTPHTWSVICHGREAVVFMDGNAICGLSTLADSWIAGNMYFKLRSGTVAGSCYISDFVIEEL